MISHWCEEMIVPQMGTKGSLENKNEIEHAWVLNRAVEMLDKKYVALKSGQFPSRMVSRTSAQEQLFVKG